MRRIIVWICFGLLLCGTAGAKDTPSVKAALKSVTLSGYTRSRTKQTLAAEVTGKVLAVNYDVGQTVQEKPFLEIDPTFVDFQINQAQLTLQKLIVSNTRAESQKDYLEKEFKRIDRLKQGNVATLAKWEAAAEQLKQAELALQTTDLEMKTLSIQLEELRERRKRHALIAPKGWIIVERRVEPGEIIATGTPLGQVADFTKAVVPMFVTGNQLNALKQKSRFKVSVDGKAAFAKLNWVNPEFDERSRKLAIELVLENYSGDIRGGLLTELTIDVPSEGLMVPKTCVNSRYNNPQVRLKKTGKKIPISILDDSGEYVIIAPTPALTVGAELIPL